MMKKMMAILMVLVLMTSVAGIAFAEGGGKLDAFADRLKKAAQSQTETAAETEIQTAAVTDDNSYGPALVIDDPFFQKVRSSAYVLENTYSKEAYVMMEMKNVSGRTLYPDSVKIAVMNAAGEVLEEDNYCYNGPEMVGNGESLFVWNWFYGFDYEISEIASYKVTIESETSSYTEYAKIDGQALVSEGLAYALVENTLESEIYGLDAVIVIENAEGRLLDIGEINTGNAVGVFPGSVSVLRMEAEDYENDTNLMEGIATAYVTYELD